MSNHHNQQLCCGARLDGLSRGGHLKGALTGTAREAVWERAQPDKYSRHTSRWA